MIIDFSKAIFDPREYFIYSDLLMDTGIECPDANIARLCLLVDRLDLLLDELNGMSLNDLVESYNFFDQYCTSKGILHMFKSVIKRRTKVRHYIPECKTLYYTSGINVSSIHFDVPLNVITGNKVMYFKDSSYDTYQLHNARREGNSILYDAEIIMFNCHGTDTRESCGIISINTFEGRIISIEIDGTDYNIVSWY